MCSQRKSDRLVDINEENGCDEKNDSVSGEVTPIKNFTLKELSEVLRVQRIKFGSCFKPKKAYDNLPSITMIFTLFTELYSGKKAHVFKLVLISF